MKLMTPTVAPQLAALTSNYCNEETVFPHETDFR